MLERFEQWPVFTLGDVEKVASSKAYAKLLVHNNLKKGKIARISRGVYSFHDDPVLAVFAFKPAYLGLEFALSFYEFWEQESVPVIITSRKVRLGVRQVSSKNVLVRRVKPAMMFGYSMRKYFDFYIPVSNPEKALVDFIYFKEPLERKVLRNLLDACEKEKLENYLTKAGFGSLAKKINKRISVDAFKTVGLT